MRIMLSYFLQISIKTFQERFELLESQSFNNVDENYASNSLELFKNISFCCIKTVDAFFEADKFKGKLLWLHKDPRYRTNPNRA